VEITTFGHALQKITEGERVLLCLIEGTDGALFAGCRSLRGETYTQENA